MTGRAAAIMLALAIPISSGAALELKETPFFAKSVQDGTLPPIAKRVPSSPDVFRPNGQKATLGRQGGTINILMARPKDTRLMVVYGYARLVKYDTKYRLVPGLVEKFDVEEGRIFTFHLRKGHRWSDGTPFTSEDFRYYWEDVANNNKLYRLGPPQTLLVDGEKPKVEIIDETTVRYSWSKPNPFFLPALANATPLYIYRPSHYLKQFHAKYVDEKKLKVMAKKIMRRRAGWTALHHNRDRMYKNDNVDLPTLQPWVNMTPSPAQRYVFRRNPYYYRVDAAGRQLPYIDEVIMIIADSKIIPVKTGAGESDLQARYLRLDSYTFLKQGEKRNDFNVHLWRTAKGSHLTFYPNLTVRDKAWRKVVRDVRFRRALSLAINRHEVNQVMYFGFARGIGNCVLKESPLYRPEYCNKWARYDLKEANRLLDAMGLDKRNAQGFRLFPDGRELEILVEYVSEGTEYDDVLSLVSDTWKKVGIRLFRKSYRRETLRRRIFAGETVMSMWSGLENGVATAMTSPDELAPTYQIQLQWPHWGQYRETGGKVGQKIDMPLPKELYRLHDAWKRAKSEDEKTRIWHRMLSIFTDQVYTIGVIAAVEQPVVTSSRLRNVPTEGVYNWDPGAHFGIYNPDQFWLAKPSGPKATARQSE